jgi:deoxyribodipyrimidine photolyase-like uncharacterized protein
LGSIINEKNDIENQLTDKRLESINIPKGLVDALNNAGFTIDIILNSHSSDIAQILGIDDYVGQIIYQETKYYYQMNLLDNREISNDNIIT